MWATTKTIKQEIDVFQRNLLRGNPQYKMVRQSLKWRAI